MLGLSPARQTAGSSRRAWAASLYSSSLLETSGSAGQCQPRGTCLKGHCTNSAPPHSKRNPSCVRILCVNLKREENDMSWNRCSHALSVPLRPSGLGVEATAMLLSFSITFTESDSSCNSAGLEASRNLPILSCVSSPPSRDFSRHGKGSTQCQLTDAWISSETLLGPSWKERVPACSEGSMHRLLQVAFAGAAPPSRILHISFSHGLCSLWPGMHTRPKSRNNDSFLRTLSNRALL